MEENKISLLGGSFLWFGASISIAEIITGALLAPLGFSMGILAVILGHTVGCILFYFVGMIGAKSRLGAMESTAITFGRYGSVFFSGLNALQLVGWTAVMIFNGANAASSVTGSNSAAVWCIVIGALIVVWISIGLNKVSKLSLVAVSALFILCIVLGMVVFRENTVASFGGTMSFGLALELSVAMPISWLPLISDYTKDTDQPVRFTMASTLCYFIGSCFMYILGLGAAIYAGSSDIVSILSAAGLGMTAMIIVVLSTVTTTFLDAYSAGMSVINIWKKLNAKTVSIIISIAGTVLAIFVPVLQYENFLYLLGSVFVPMASIMIADYFFNKNTDKTARLNITNTVLWIIGFAVYRVFLNLDTILGSTVPVIIIVMLLCVITNLIKNKENKNA